MTSPPSQVRSYETHARTSPVFGRVLCSSRNHHFVIDGPVGNGCPGEALTPPEIFLASVAACGAELIQVIARDEKRPLGGVEVTVTGEVDRGRQKRADVTLFTKVHLDIVLTGADDAAAAALVEGFKRR